MPKVDLSQSLKALAEQEPRFAAELLEDAIGHMLDGKSDEGRILLKNYVRATIGFKELARLTGKDEKNLMRSLSERGNPTASNLFEIIKTCVKHEKLVVAIDVKPEKKKLESAA